MWGLFSKVKATEPKVKSCTLLQDVVVNKSAYTIVEDFKANVSWLLQDFKRNSIECRNITSARHPKEMHSCCKGHVVTSDRKSRSIA